MPCPSPRPLIHRLLAPFAVLLLVLALAALVVLAFDLPPMTRLPLGAPVVTPAP